MFIGHPVVLPALSHQYLWPCVMKASSVYSHKKGKCLKHFIILEHLTTTIILLSIFNLHRRWAQLVWTQRSGVCQWGCVCRTPDQWGNIIERIDQSVSSIHLAIAVPLDAVEAVPLQIVEALQGDVLAPDRVAGDGLLGDPYSPHSWKQN